ncbi:MAG: LacI family DNA-binding transcriptional regulator, partial [Clostridia bacterium]|nr:LacI family DNA-binding transcriptional regulator [Clostridia bacterium]
MDKITIKDVARLAGVSVATVSYIINGKHEDRYTLDTKRKVLQIVNLYSFRPSRLAQSFALGKSRNVILLTDKHET